MTLSRIADATDLEGHDTGNGGHRAERGQGAQHRIYIMAHRSHEVASKQGLRLEFGSTSDGYSDSGEKDSQGAPAAIPGWVVYHLPGGNRYVEGVAQYSLVSR